MDLWYSAFGLTISSPIELPELRACEPLSTNADVLISLGEVAKPPSGAFFVERWIETHGDSVILFWPDVGGFKVQDGSRITIDPCEGCNLEVIRLFLLGTTLAILLHQRGLAVFHAGAVDIAGQGVMLVGKKGAGKSSLAGMLYSLGHGFLSDDLAVMDLDVEPYLLRPGFPHLKLWPDSAETIFTGQTLRRLRPESEKLGYRFEQESSDWPPLRAVLFLDEGDCLRLDSLGPQQAAIDLMSNWYGARFGQDLFAYLGPELHLRQCTSVAAKAVAYRFYRPNNISGLKSQAEYLVQSLERDLAISAKK